MIPEGKTAPKGSTTDDQVAALAKRVEALERRRKRGDRDGARAKT